MKSKDAYLDTDIARDGEVVRRPIHLMDSLQRAITGVDQHTRGYRSSTSETVRDAQRAARNSRDAYVRNLSTAWDAKKRRQPPDDDDKEDVEGNEGQDVTDPEQVGRSALSVDAARRVANDSYRKMCDRLASAWRTSDHNAAAYLRQPEPRLEPHFPRSDEPVQSFLRKPDGDAQARKDAEYKKRCQDLENAWRTDPKEASKIERQGEIWRHGK
jgi:Arc/MetJ-type ribon-helix-helix transcriptional regulator